ncbi:Uncharacterised protein [Mycobacterium tuberculosis]|nr:Uncharacterised protein [Mycobacterium tuberculosis]
MCPGESVEKRLSPAVHVVGEHLASQRPHSPPARLLRLVERFLYPVLDAFQVVRVDQVCVPEFGCGPGEFAEHQGTAKIAAASDVLLGHQVHPVA